jgi:hypothetical protein
VLALTWGTVGCCVRSCSAHNFDTSFSLLHFSSLDSLVTLLCEFCTSSMDLPSTSSAFAVRVVFASAPIISEPFAATVACSLERVLGLAVYEDSRCSGTLSHLLVAGALLLPVIHLYTVSTLNTVSTPMVEIHGCRAGRTTAAVLGNINTPYLCHGLAGTVISQRDRARGLRGDRGRGATHRVGERKQTGYLLRVLRAKTPGWPGTPDFMLMHLWVGRPHIP